MDHVLPLRYTDLLYTIVDILPICLPCDDVEMLLSVRRGDVLSAWSGIRPLVVNPNASHTKSIARNHIIEVSKTNLITIAGMWSLYGQMIVGLAFSHH